MSKDPIDDFIERAEETWLYDTRTEDERAKAFSLLHQDFCVAIGIIKAFRALTSENGNG